MIYSQRKEVTMKEFKVGEYFNYCGKKYIVVEVCQDDFYLGDISYVHQLQHLLFGLGLNSEMEV